MNLELVPGGGGGAIKETSKSADNFSKAPLLQKARFHLFL